MKIWIDSDEWYPVYTAEAEQYWDEGDFHSVEVPETFWARYKDTMRAFEAMQSELGRLRDKRSRR